MIERYLKELEETWGHTTEELRDIKLKMANYAFEACLDSAVRKEAERICQLNNKIIDVKMQLKKLEQDLENECQY